MISAVAAAGLAFLIAGLVGWRAPVLGQALGLLDWPDPAGGRKLHARVTPLVGGIGVVPAALLGGFISWAAVESSPVVSHHLIWFTVVSGSLFLIGVADDRFGLGPRMRLLASVIAFALAVIYAPDFRVSFLLFTGAPVLLLSGTLGAVFSLLCLVGLLNAVNMADGKDGLVVSLSLLWTIILWAQAPAFLHPLFVALTVGLTVIFAFNMSGRLFLGDGGSYGLSALLGLLAIYSYNHGFAEFRADRLALLFAVPVFDTVRLITTRALKGRSPFEADRDHLHHHIAFRWGWPRGLAIYLALVGIPNLIALVRPELALPLLLLTVPAYAAIVILTTRRTTFTGEIVPQPGLKRGERNARSDRVVGGV